MKLLFSDMKERNKEKKDRERKKEEKKPQQQLENQKEGEAVTQTPVRVAQAGAGWQEGLNLCSITSPLFFGFIFSVKHIT